MSNHTFRPSIARVQNAQKIFTSTKTNATIRDLEEEEGELEEKEGVVVSIKRDLINGKGWTVKDKDGQIYVCSCASSMYEVPETVERGGILYPTDTVEVIFTINPVLRINTIKEIKSLGEETEALDVSKWTHGDESTTVIAKPKSALSISNGFIKFDYNNDNQMLADANSIKTQGKKTEINTDKLSINSKDIDINGMSVEDLLHLNGVAASNEYVTYTFDSPGGSINIDRTNNITQVDINANNLKGYGVIGQIKDQKSVPIKELSQRLITDGDNVDIVTIDTDGVIRICPFEKDDIKCDTISDYTRNIQSLTQWITPQVEARNYIKVTIKENCDYCDEVENTESEFINYCPSCQNWNCLVDTSTSKIKCTRCSTEYCQDCGTSNDGTLKLKKYQENYIIGYGTTCNHCNTQLKSGTTKYYVDYCPDCKSWKVLEQEEYYEQDNIINVLRCIECGKQFCCTCGISQTSYGLNLNVSDNPVQYGDYKEALRKLKYIKG